MPAEEHQNNDKVEEKDIAQLSEESKELSLEATNNEEESSNNAEENSGVAEEEKSPDDSKIEETEDDFRSQPQFVCCCGASFQFLGQITSHKKKNCEWIYVCPHCDRVYKDFDKMTAHKGTHDTVKIAAAAASENKEIKDGDSTSVVSKTDETTKDNTDTGKVVDKSKSIVRPQNTASVNNKPRFQKTNPTYMGARPAMGMMNNQMGNMGNYGMNPMMMGNMGMNPGMGQFGPMNPMMMGNFMPYNQFCQPNMMNMMPNMGMANMNQNMGYMGPNMGGPNMCNPNMGGPNMCGPNMGGPNMCGPNMGFNGPNQMGNVPPGRGKEYPKNRSDTNYSPRSQGRSSSPGRPGESPPLDSRRRESKFDKDDEDMIDPLSKHVKMDRRQTARYSGGDSDTEWPGERGKMIDRYSDRGGSDSEKESYFWGRRTDEQMALKRGSSGRFLSKSEGNQRDNSDARISNSYGFSLKRDNTDMSSSGLQSKMMRPDHRF